MDSGTKNLNLSEGKTLSLSHIPSGYFLMGADNVHFYLSNYYIGIHPVTVKQFKCLIDANGYNDQRLWSQYGWEWLKRGNFGPPESSRDTQKLEHPQVGISWYEACAFCRWLSQSCGHNISLPNEMEWEKAARGLDGKKYPWGDNLPTPGICNFGNYYKLTTPVGSFPAGNSLYRCCDMAGNVLEWCRNLYEGPVPYDSPQLREGSDTRNLISARGGSFLSPAPALVTWSRDCNYPGVRRNHLGFRIVIHE
jgi:formylglycine-generating enzyme required for sulfatase activity